MRLRILIEALPASVRLWTLTIVDGIILWFALLMIREGMSLVQRTMGGKMSALGIPIGTTYYVLPAAAVLMAIFASVRGLNRVVGHYLEGGGRS